MTTAWRELDPKWHRHVLGRLTQQIEQCARNVVDKRADAAGCGDAPPYAVAKDHYVRSAANEEQRGVAWTAAKAALEALLKEDPR